MAKESTYNYFIYIAMPEISLNQILCKCHICDTVRSYKIYYDTDLYSRLALLYNHRIQLVMKICITTGISTTT